MKTDSNNPAAPKLTDEALFGQAVAGMEGQDRKAYTDTQDRKSYTVSAPVSSPKPKTESKPAGIEMIAFRIQQSLCLFPLNDVHQVHYPTYKDKLNHLLEQRGLTPEDRATIKAEFTRQYEVMKEALA